MKRAVFCLGLLTLLACDKADEPAHKVVAVLPLSGDFKVQGENHLRGIQMAIDTLQRAQLADVLGLPVRVLLVDAGQKETLEQNVTDAIAEAKKNEQSGQEFMGVISSTQSAFENSLPLAIQNQVPHFEVAAGADESEFIHDHEDDHDLDDTWAFNTRALCNDEAVMTANFVKTRYAATSKRILLFRQTKVHDKMHTKALYDALAGDPDTSVTFISSTDADEANGNEEGSFILPDTTSWQDYLEELINREQPDVVYFHLQGDGPNEQVLLDLSKINGGEGFQGDIITCGMARKKDLIDPTKNDGLDPNYLVGRFFFMMRAPVGSTNLDAFKADYAEFWGEDAHTFAPGAFDAAVLMLLGHAKSKLGGADIRDAVYDVAAPTGTIVGYTSLGEAVQHLREGAEIDYDGPSGSLDMELETHIVPGAYYVEAVEPSGEGFKYLELEEPARETLRNGEVMPPK